MARYTGAQCKLCRREGLKLYLKGDRCYTGKCAIDRRSYPPGQHGQSRRKVSEYGLQLRAKQRARRIYGVLERQFRNYFKEAARQPGVTGDNLLRLLERRLDNVVYRLGLAVSRTEARQLVNHGHFEVNGRKVNIPSYLVRVGDEITVRERSKQSAKLKDLIERASEKTPPAWLEYDAEQVKGRVVALPNREQIDVPVEEHLIVERYSR
ncbi:30S ribosomal protein S4 [Desulfofalx alkaliphila]|uniref:30S ribosomal protein S4 n=1 Tax=Desulfofalx alkaliphila TaxID=105483 RepID=UPI0004E1F5D8|nr:30S ribosomal protein S4 [Desulfofalx alkaliphila]